MPDALSKTVPIWATTLNRLLFPDERDFHSLQVPGDVVSASEAQQIDLRIDGFLTQLGTLELDIVALRAQLQERPMRCVWQRPGDITSSDGCDRSRHNTIVLCTASNFTSTEASTDLNYIQGAADDHETWSLGLDAASFWTHCERFLNSAEQDLPELVAAVMAESPHSRVVNPPVLIKPTKMLWLGDEASADVHASDFDLVISCTMSPQDALAKQFKKRYLCLPCTTGKLGSRQLRTELSRIEELSELGNFKIEPSPQKILVTCPSGTDLAVGIALAIVCRFGTETGSLDLNQAAPRINKDIIKHRLSWIMISAPHVKPSRATLQSVNAFLMSD
jgi:tRNA A64-2'-O-ribosylphosphate transferase